MEYYAFAGIVLVPLAVYALVRIGAAAWFKSKQQFDQPKKGQRHGTA